MPIDTSLNQAFINGEFRPAKSGKTYPLSDPANGLLLSEVADCGPEDAEAAILAAHECFTEWSKQSAKQRAEILLCWHKLIIENQLALATLMTRECGKPLQESVGEVVYAAAFLEWFAEEAKRTYGEITPSPIAKRRLLTIKQPIGVCSAITPWNFPAAMITRKCAPALAAGCTMVLKPAEATPLSALALAALAREAGLPAGAFNVVTASQGKTVGEVFSTHPLVRKLSFTGSTAVGKILLRQCAETVKRVSMELGGNAPFIVFEDADLDAAVEGAMASKYRNSGQTCVCVNRFFVHNKIADEFAEKLTRHSCNLRLGHGLDEGITQGPLINSSALAKVSRLVKDALDKGATALCGAKPSALGRNFYEPTVLTGITQNMQIANEEIFGPIATISTFDSESEVIALANNTVYGLAAYFYSRDLARVWRVAEALEYGMVGINEGIISTELAPFGGVKESGLGREGSRHGIDEYLELKYLCMGGLN